MSNASDYANNVSRIYESSANARAAATRENGQIWAQGLGALATGLQNYPIIQAQRAEAQQRREIGAMQLDAAKRQAAAEQAYNAAISAPGVIKDDGSIDLEQFRSHVAGTPAAAKFPEMVQHVTAMQEASLKLAKARQDAAQAEADHVGAIAAVADVYDDPKDKAGALLTGLSSGVKDGTVPRDKGLAIIQGFLGPDGQPDPQRVSFTIAQMKAASKQAQEMEKTRAETANAAAEQKIRAAQLPGIQAESAQKQQVAANMQGGLTAEQQAVNARADAAAKAAAANTAADNARADQQLAISRGQLGVAQARERREGAAAVVGQTMGGANVPEVPAGQKNEAFLKTLPEGIAAQVKALDEGRMAFPTGSALRAQYWQNMLEAVSKYDRSFDAVNYNARAKTRSDFTSGASAKQVNAINTVIGHLDSLSQAADALGNSNFPLFNTIANAISKATGSPKVTNFNTVKKAVSDEVTRVWRQSGGTEADIQSAQANLDAANSPTQLHQAIATYGELLESKLGALQTQYQQGMGTDDVQMVTPAARATLATLMRKAGKTPTTNAAPAANQPIKVGGFTVTVK